jgi:hypothetical protein
LSLAKVTLMLKQSVKLRRYVLCGGVAACYVQVWCVTVRRIVSTHILKKIRAFQRKEIRFSVYTESSRQ